MTVASECDNNSCDNIWQCIEMIYCPHLILDTFPSFASTIHSPISIVNISRCLSRKWNHWDGSGGESRRRRRRRRTRKTTIEMAVQKRAGEEGGGPLAWPHHLPGQVQPVPLAHLGIHFSVFGWFLATSITLKWVSRATSSTSTSRSRKGKLVITTWSFLEVGVELEAADLSYREFFVLSVIVRD